MWKKEGKMSKYHSRKTVLDGITFDSGAEASRWSQLRLMERANLIHDLERQVSFQLVPEETGPDGKRLRPMRYVADFVYKDAEGKVHVEDVKGVRTEAYKIKKRLMWHILGIAVEET